jgi:hypothetical protein
MRLKMKTTLAGPGGVVQAGAVTEMFDAETAKALCDGGYAEALAPLAGHALDTPDGSAATSVEIPESWRTLGAKEMKALADQLVETPVKTRNEAIAVIEAALAARGAPASDPPPAEDDPPPAEPPPA